MALARAHIVKANTPDVPTLAVWFGSPAAITAEQLPPAMVAQLMALGIPARAAREAGALGLSVRLTGRTKYGSPAATDGMTVLRRVSSEEPAMRARYVLAAARRLAAGIATDDYDPALKREQNYLSLHVEAGRKRRVAAALVDAVAKNSATGFMRWNTMNDSRVDGVCRGMEGRLFTIDNLPDGQVPGAVHPRCRCYATAWGGAPLRT